MHVTVIIDCETYIHIFPDDILNVTAVLSASIPTNAYPFKIYGCIKNAAVVHNSKQQVLNRFQLQESPLMADLSSTIAISLITAPGCEYPTPRLRFFLFILLSLRLQLCLQRRDYFKSRCRPEGWFRSLLHVSPSSSFCTGVLHFVRLVCICSKSQNNGWIFKCFSFAACFYFEHLYVRGATWYWRVNLLKWGKRRRLVAFKMFFFCLIKRRSSLVGFISRGG